MIVYVGYELSAPDGVYRTEQAFRFPDDMTPGVAIAMSAARLVLALQASVTDLGDPQTFKILSTTVEDDRHAVFHDLARFDAFDSAAAEG